MAKHRAQPVRPRYGRISVLATSLAVTAVAVLGASGVLPTPGGETARGAANRAATAEDSPGPVAAPTPNVVASPEVDASPEPAAASPEAAPAASPEAVPAASSEAVPADSGQGRRIVFSQSRQRVWLVTRSGRVQRTYPVSGSVEDNLDPGTYTVYSRSEDAVGIDDSGTMRHFVRFTQGPSGAAIGFHDIPVDDGRRVQTVAQLGTPRSHGCIRQRPVDARALWAFAPLGTTVVVTP
ncbi:L,D-transpeptidase [Nocardioides pantholopis]|uniref:L,D-transpeptidase n=1 Tax=Nocardioides pantholopis TaxID=2483798 RepID=UPI0013DDD401|nr:L,D-transpeptidase [Nocardioides pantholopis]